MLYLVSISAAERKAHFVGQRFPFGILCGQGCMYECSYLVMKRKAELPRAAFAERPASVIAIRTFEKSARNLPNVTVIQSGGVNVYDVLHRDSLLLTQGAVEALTKRLGG